MQAAKEIIDEAGEGLLTIDTINVFAKLLIEMYHKTDERIKENNDMLKDTDAEEDDEPFDKDDLEVVKEENNNEYDLQLSIAEMIGILFKTHGSMCGNLI